MKKQKGRGEFAPTAYSIAGAYNLPIFLKQEDQEEEVAATVGMLVEELHKKRIEASSPLTNIKVKKDGKEYYATGDDFSTSILKALIALCEKGVDGFHASWYYYERDSVVDDYHESYRFFVVSGKEIVAESVSFSKWSGSGFDISIFRPRDHSKSTWFADAAWGIAQDRYWYDKFYTETEMGRLMVLRPDNPPLFYLEAAGTQSHIAYVSRLKRIEYLLWGIIAMLILQMLF